MKISVGRANLSNQQIFYASFDPGTIIPELGCDVGTCLNIITVKPKNDDDLYIIPIGQLDSVRRFRRVMIGNEDHTKIIREHLAVLKEPVKMAVAVADAFFADEFLQKDPKKEDEEVLSQYYITNLIAQRMRENPRCGGIAYPSVKYNGGFNVALDAEAYDNMCEPVSFEAVRIVSDLGYGMNKLGIYADGTQVAEDGTLHWTWPLQQQGMPKNLIEE